jgi:hypothetical protein
MVIQFRCPAAGCGALIGVRPDLAGKRARCPQCRQVVLVPAGQQTPSVDEQVEPEPAVEPAQTSAQSNTDIRLEVVRELVRMGRQGTSAWAPVVSLTAMVGFAALLFMEAASRGHVWVVLMYVFGLGAGAVAVVDGSRRTGLRRALSLVLCGFVMLSSASAALGGHVWGLALSLLGIGFGLVAGACAAATAGRWDRPLRVVLALAAAVLFFNGLVVVLWVVTNSLSSVGLAAMDSSGHVHRMGAVVLFLLALAVLLVVLLQSLTPRGSAALSAAVVWLLQILAWVFVVGVLIAAIQADPSATVGERVRTIAVRTLGWALPILSIYLVAVGIRDLLAVEHET